MFDDTGHGQFLDSICLNHHFFYYSHIFAALKQFDNIVSNLESTNNIVVQRK